MFAKKYTLKQYIEAYVTGVKQHPYLPPVGKYRPVWLAYLRLTPYYYTADDLWMSYREGFERHPRPKDKKR